MAKKCPCGAGARYRDCCGRLHEGRATAETAAELMRSRFSAFAAGDEAYLLRTWHPATRPERIGAEDGTRWTRLEILRAENGGPGDDKGIVEFRAHYLAGAQPGELHEASRFVRHDGEWVYVIPAMTGEPLGWRPAGGPLRRGGLGAPEDAGRRRDGP